MIIVSVPSTSCKGRTIVEAAPLCEKPLLLNILVSRVTVLFVTII